MDYQQLSFEELQRRKWEIEQQQIELDRLLKQRLREDKGDFVRELRDMIIGRGYEVEDIGEQLIGRRRKAGEPVTGKRYVDPENPEHTYKRGPLPQWFKEKMLARGYNPEDKQQRETFKAEHLTLLAA